MHKPKRGMREGPHLQLHEQDFGRTTKERKKENTQPKGGMGERHAATTQGF